MIGRSLGRYRVMEQVAAGGMGVVYRAHDTRLDRDVALKMLAPGLFADQNARERFRHEALALSRLNHSHICSIYDFDSAGADDFLVMEMVRGTTLSARIQRGALAEKDVLSLGRQIAEALAAAHEQGIVHRDLKPGNVMVDERGQVKVLDFGLARHLPSATAETMIESLTATGKVIGTLPYMAPEQLMGGEPGERADLYSLGVVLYEMATRTPPFRHAVPIALADAILHQTPSAPRERAAHVSSGLEALILRCLEKDPASRPEKAQEIAEALEALERGEASKITRHSKRKGARGRALAFAGAAGLVLALGLGGTWWTATHGRIDSLAILPFVAPSSDAELDVLRDGLTEAIINRLSGLSDLRVIARASVARFRDKPDLDLGNVARQLHVSALVMGRMVRRGSEVVVDVEMVDPRDNRQLWGDEFAPRGGNWGLAEQDIASAIAGKLNRRLTGRESSRLKTASTSSGDAYRLYLRGRSALSRFTEDGMTEALSYFEQAAAIDPHFSLAYSGMSEAYYGASNLWRSPREAMPRARAAATHALDLDSLSAEAHTSLAFVLAQYDWKWSEAEAEYRKALTLSPSFAPAHLGYGLLLTALARFREARIEFLKARDLDPLNPQYSVLFTMVLTNSGRNAEAIAEVRQILRADPLNASAWGQLGIDLAIEGNWAESDRAISKTIELQPELWLRAHRAYCAARCGKTELARSLLAQVKKSVRDEASVYYQIAQIHAELGDMDEAFAWFEKAYEMRCENIIFFKSDPMADQLRADPRGREVLRRMHLDG